MNAPIPYRSTGGHLTSNPARDPAPIQPEQEWANALTHAIAAKLSVIAGGILIVYSLSVSTPLTLAAAAYMASVFATFFASFLSHFFLKQPWLNTFRAWDQAMIYTMIVGTYTPLAAVYLAPPVRTILIALMWTFALIGALSKIGWHHRINDISPLPYIMLGWAPAVVLAQNTPADVSILMLLGGLVYCIGIYFLMYDDRGRYYHAIWHLLVMTAATIHYAGIWMVATDAV